MDTQTPTKTGTDTAIQIVNAVFGITHFMLQSAADLTAHAEGKLVNKISKGAITVEQSKEYRVASTQLKQAKVLSKLKEMQDKIKASQQTETITEPQLQTA